MFNWLKRFSSKSQTADHHITQENAPAETKDTATTELDSKALATQLFKAGKYTEAITCYQQAIQQAPDAQLHNQLGDVYYELGDYLHAEQAYRQALNIQADFVDAAINLGLSLDAQGKLADAVACYQSLINSHPDNYLAYFNLGVSLSGMGNGGQATLAYQTALRIKPDFSHAHFNLAILLQHQGQIEEAEQHYMQTLEINASHFAALCNLGLLYQSKGLLEQAKTQFQQALLINPQHAPTHHNMGLLAYQQDDLGSARSHFLQALQLRPDAAETLVCLGDVNKKQNHLVEAEANYRQAISLQSSLARAYCNLGVLLNDQARYAEAISIYQQGIRQDAASAVLQNNLGNTYKSVNRLSEALACYQEALRLAPDVAETHSNLATLLAIQGKFDEAENSYRQSLQLDGKNEQAYSNFLFLLNYHPERSSAEIFSAYQDYERKFALPLKEKTSLFGIHDINRNQQRRLKIAYISPDYCRHPVQHFLEPLLDHHNKQEFEVYAYAELGHEDAVTARYKNSVDHWIPITGMSDLEVCQRIRADGIDILVDLAGHTANNRLHVLARKPAPIQVSWLGYGYTTGLSVIDYFLTDEICAPPGSEHLFAEKIWRIPKPSLAYRPATGMGEVSALPALGNAHITFGTLTRAIRINDKTIKVWAEILHRVANARLLIDSANFQDEDLRASLLTRFSAHGIAASRLEIGFHSPPWDTLRQIDIGLDCFPHNSGTTLFETLYMGVPYVTLAGRPSMGLLGSSILHGLGQTDWIASSEEEYVEIAVSLAGKLPQLAETRAGLRQKMVQSALMNEADLAKKIEAAYRSMWQQWCSEQITA